ncbi:MAG: acyl-CoA dehydrogenase [Polyangiaceae bacterium]|jgi:alkylation response protein AidB-like acyl-CoA dehydrogenase
MTDRRRPFWLEEALGDPCVDEGPTGFRWAMRLDELEEFPADAAARLDGLGVHRHYVPAAMGGELESFESLATLLRCVARRDLTLAIGHGKTLLATQPVFLGAEPALKEMVAARVLAGEPMALGLTERENGSDLLASRTLAATAERPCLVSGEKWLINNATRSTALCVLARTKPAGGPRGFSLFFVDKSEAEGTYTALPKIRTHGIRGADISGIRFESTPCSTPPIGGEGAALAITLKTFAVTRTLIPILAVGALDSALRIVLEFARNRSLYGGTVLQIRHARTVLARSIADLLGCEAMALAGARLLHHAPDQACFWSSVVKVHVPTTIERTLRDLAVIFGARHYLREGLAFGMFEKIKRDVDLLGLFDGSTIVNLSNIALHARPLARGEQDRVADAFSLLGPLPEFEPNRLTPMARSVWGAEVLASRAAQRLAGCAHADHLGPALESLGRRARSARDELSLRVPATAFDMSAALVRMAATYAGMAARALAANVFVDSRVGGTAVLRGADWLLLLLADAADDGTPTEAIDAAGERLLQFALAAMERNTAVSLLAD